MKRSFTRTLSVLLSLLMALSVFAGLGVTANAGTAWTLTDSLPTESGEYYLADDVTIDSSWYPAEGITTLDLNGHGIIMTGSASAVIADGYQVRLYIEDSNPTVEHKFTLQNETAGAGFAVVDDSLTENYKTFQGGYITGGHATEFYGGGAIRITGDASVYMYGGTLIGNSSDQHGGAVGIAPDWGSGLFSMIGGSIIYNKCKYAGGAINLGEGSTLTLSGGTIAYNLSTDGTNQYHPGGIKTLSDSNFLIYGDPCVYGNIGGSLSGIHNALNNICLEGMLTVIGEMTNTVPIGVTMNTEGHQGATDGVFTDTVISNLAYNDASKFTSDVWDFSVNKDAASGQLYIDAAVPTDHSADGATATFAGEEGDPIAPAKTVYPGTALRLPTREEAAEAPAGFVLADWFDGTNSFKPGSVITLDADTTFVGRYAQGITVTFDAEGGSAVASQYIPINTIPELPATPHKTGVVLKGWRLDGSYYYFDTPLTGDVTLHAMWGAPGTESFDEYGYRSSLEAPVGWKSSGNWKFYREGTLNGNSFNSHLNGTNSSNRSGLAIVQGSGEHWLISPVLDLSGRSSATLVFWIIRSLAVGVIPYGSLRISYRVNGGGWHLIESILTVQNLNSWTEESVALPEEALTDLVEIGFHVSSRGSSTMGIALDDIGIDDAMPESHLFAYNCEDNVISVRCKNDSCSIPNHSMSLSLNAPEKTVYNDGKSAKATLSPNLDIFNAELKLSLSAENVRYYKDGVLLDEPPTEPGDYTIALTVPSNRGNYTLRNYYTIENADPTACTVEANDRTYDGSTQPLLTVTGTAEGGEMQYKLEGGEYGTDIPTAKSAGSYTVCYKTVGDEFYNDIPEASVDVTVSPKDLTVSADAKEKFRGEGDPTLTYQTEGLIEGDSITVTLSRDTGETVGTYNINADITAPDYDVTYVGALLTIKPNADDDAAAAVTEKIEAIGTVSYDDESKAKIDEAREAYDALTEDQQALVPAAAKQALTDAEDTYASLKAQAEKEEADRAAAEEAAALIEAIGTVSYDDESKAKIDAAREAFNALTEDQQALVPAATKQALTDAENEYAALKAQAEKEETDRAAAEEAAALIDAIGKVTYDNASKKRIDAARKAFDALTVDQKALLDPAKEETLIKAEKAYAALWSSDVKNHPHGEHCFCYDYEGDGMMASVVRLLCAIYCFYFSMRAALNV
ncbi:MAG: InlB B-repeat-containing protein [Clostridia bacterium]|nr:InlB B-repeat-containing protein [Clostridia bacterium]